VVGIAPARNAARYGDMVNMNRPLRLTDGQLSQLRNIAARLPRRQRTRFLCAVADELCDRDFSDGDLYRVCQQVARAIIDQNHRDREAYISGRRSPSCTNG